jgi:hypothetical protein
MTGTGGQLYTALNNNHPSAPEVLKALFSYFECCPLLRMSYLFSNLAMMQAFGDAKRVHIVDYGILYGMQWPSLIYYLSQRPGGPPHLRITGIFQWHCPLHLELNESSVAIEIPKFCFFIYKNPQVIYGFQELSS